MIVVSDTSPLRALHQVDLLWLIPRLFETVLIPPAVANELQKSRPHLKPVHIGDMIGVEIRSPAQADRVRRFAEVLDPGEAEAIALALEVRCRVVLIDEAIGRGVAEREGLKPTGVLGILTKAKRQGLIQSVEPVIRRLRDDHAFFLSDTIVRRLLQRLNEAPPDA